MIFQYTLTGDIGGQTILTKTELNKKTLAVKKNLLQGDVAENMAVQYAGDINHKIVKLYYRDCTGQMHYNEKAVEYISLYIESQDKREKVLALIDNILCRGCPDFLCLDENYEPYFVEVKTDSSLLTAEQKKIKAMIQKAGYKYEVQRFPNFKLNLTKPRIEVDSPVKKIRENTTIGELCG